MVENKFNGEQELAFINFCISFHKRLGQIIDKWRNIKELDILPEEEEDMLRALHRCYYEGELAFGNENRDPSEIITE